LPTHSIIMNIF